MTLNGVMIADARYVIVSVDVNQKTFSVAKIQNYWVGHKGVV